MRDAVFAYDTRQLRGNCVECGGSNEGVVGAGFIMTTGCSVCQAAGLSSSSIGMPTLS
jgi:hypothetical protein